jgi:hypothetical protein
VGAPTSPGTSSPDPAELDSIEIRLRDEIERLILFATDDATAEAWRRALADFDAKPEVRAVHVARHLEWLQRCEEERQAGEKIKRETGCETVTRNSHGRICAHFADGKRRDVTDLYTTITTTPRLGGRTMATARRSAPRARGAGRPRARTATRSSAKSGDSGSDSDEPEPPAPGRRCTACGADISHRRIDAKTCEGTRCRKAKSRGKVAPPPSPVIRIDRPLEDEIAAKAWQRHLAWAPDVRPGIRDDLTLEIEDLYAELRRRRARQPLPAFEGKVASYDVDSRAAQAWRRPRRRRSGAVTTKQLEAVAA